MRVAHTGDTPSSDTVAVGANGKHNYSPEDDDDDDIALPQISQSQLKRPRILSQTTRAYSEFN